MRGYFVQTPGQFTQELASRANDNPLLCSPGSDGLGLGDIPFCFVFGCPSLDTLKSWFVLGSTDAENVKIVKQLKENGFILAEYLIDAEDYLVSNSGTQVAFDGRHAREDGLMQVIDIETLLENTPRAFAAC